MRSEIVPPNRWLTIALCVGLLALIGYGAWRRDPATIAIIAALVAFFGLPFALLYTLNRRAQLRPPALPDERDDPDD
ncbi:MAG: hypothetical protein KGO05_03195 [Chloroflexota bacterium]|nr:hypothetical protein [Chloroflexota bacterium]